MNYQERLDAIEKLIASVPEKNVREAIKDACAAAIDSELGLSVENVFDGLMEYYDGLPEIDDTPEYYRNITDEEFRKLAIFMNEHGRDIDAFVLMQFMDTPEKQEHYEQYINIISRSDGIETLADMREFITNTSVEDLGKYMSEDLVDADVENDRDYEDMSDETLREMIEDRGYDVPSKATREELLVMAYEWDGNIDASYDEWFGQEQKPS